MSTGIRKRDQRLEVRTTLEERALIAPTRAERKRLYSYIEHRVASAVPIVYLFNPSYVYAQRTTLTDFAPNAFTPTWNAATWHNENATQPPLRHPERRRGTSHRHAPRDRA